MTKIISGIILVISIYGISKTVPILYKYGYHGGLYESFAILGFIISSIAFTIATALLYKSRKKNNS